jgi:hypothetical protein
LPLQFWIADLQVEWSDGSDSIYFISDFVAGIEAAAADGCDVINFSTGINPSKVDLATFIRPVELAMKNAAVAGVFIAAAGGNTGPGGSVAGSRTRCEMGCPDLMWFL